MADINILNQILAEILVCSCDALELGVCEEPGSRCGCPCRTFIKAGTPNWDLEACCSDGQLAVYVRNLFPSTNFPSRGNDPNTCAQSLAANVTVQLLRCWPAILKDDGSAPSGPEIQAASEEVYRDLYLLTVGILCCFKANSKNRRFVLNDSRVVGPKDTCVGVEVDITIEIV